MTHENGTVSRVKRDPSPCGASDVSGAGKRSKTQPTRQGATNSGVVAPELGRKGPRRQRHAVMVG